MAATEDQQLSTTIEDMQIHGDVLETIFSHVPLIHLASASHVSKSWCTAVSSSLRHSKKPKPWLILHTQSTRFPYSARKYAYDPRSNIWMKISQPSIKHISALKSSHSNFLYMLSPSKFSFSLDPLNCHWCHVDPPLVWRTDPIVARVGDHIIVAGGACDFEDDPLALEIYNLTTRVWQRCDSLPRNLKDSAASDWLSMATTGERLVVAEKQSGVTHCFDPVSKSWSDSIVLDPGQPVSSFNIGCSNNGLILVGLCRNRNGEGVRIWGVFGEDFECEEIGEMPVDYVEKLKGESLENFSIDVRVAGNVVYVYSAWEVVACELVDGGRCRWWSVRNVAARDDLIMERLVFTCSEVGIDELQRVMGAEIELSLLS
ncbi:hypothetical protein ACJIZ3_010321 [Penstemon smallii]|uniref:F-box domain-containing protein n=1 Tax=Penstemon smallii TaxID=265156 RepID=A0ABD3TGM2_9LAMI